MQRTLGRLLAECEPLLSFDDELSAARTGQRCRDLVAARTTDRSLLTTLAEACDQIGLPPPDSEVVQGADSESLEIMRIVTGVTLVAQTTRLERALQAHAGVLGRGGAAVEVDIADVELLRDVTPGPSDRSPRAWQRVATVTGDGSS